MIYPILIEHHHVPEAMEHRHPEPSCHIVLVSEEIKSLAQKEQVHTAFFIEKKKKSSFDPARWYGEGGGSGVQDWELMLHLWRIHVDVWQNQYGIVK